MYSLTNSFYVNVNLQKLNKIKIIRNYLNLLIEFTRGTRNNTINKVPLIKFRLIDKNVKKKKTIDLKLFIIISDSLYLNTIRFNLFKLL